MLSRRGVLTGAGLMFCGCCLKPARAQAPARLPVSVGGRTVRTVDGHCHCLFQDALSLMGGEAASILPPTKGVAEHFLERGVDERLRGMDAMAVDMEILSINPYWYGTDRATAARIVELNNTHLAEICHAHPDRFGAYAALSLQFPDLAVQQLEDAMRNKGLKGAAIGTAVQGEAFSDAKFHPVWAKAEELGAVLFIHPQFMPELARRQAGNGWLANVAAYPLDTTLCLEHLIFEGVMDKFPNLKLLSAHGGGFIASYAERMDHGCFVSPQNCNPGIVLKKRPSEYLRQMYFDSLVFTPEALRHMAANVGASQIVLGTDFPIPWELHPVDVVMATDSFSDDDKLAILGGNAARLFGLSA